MTSSYKTMAAQMSTDFSAALKRASASKALQDVIMQLYVDKYIDALIQKGLVETMAMIKTMDSYTDFQSIIDFLVNKGMDKVVLEETLKDVLTNVLQL
jgi:hypothetical protein